VHNNTIIARGMNATNRTLNGTRHAEFQAIASILSPVPLPPSTSPNSVPAVDPARPKYTADVLRECDLYVTVEPCIMCASLLRQFGIRKVYFGAANDRFGGTGGVMNIHDCRAVDPPYKVSGGWLREEAIVMLRRFYVQENEKGECLFICICSLKDVCKIYPT
jgi:tRNA-specific adenosine deaminase 2